MKNFNKVDPSWKSPTHSLEHHAAAVAIASNADNLTSTTATTDDNGMVQEHDEGFATNSTPDSSIKPAELG